MRNQYDDVSAEDLKGLQGEVRGLKRSLNLEIELQSDIEVRKLEGEDKE